ncbi:MAG TPA: hypothetical protein DCZ94_08360 [Lentisphaeria bacterium]|nr:MAG: hypothetical protein A2X48_19840 [Lentisphaerae bacterium GWF2_49_21]HBC86950.1 hypothetical protein [Lentisphaeria bacterium]
MRKTAKIAIFLAVSCLPFFACSEDIQDQPPIAPLSTPESPKKNSPPAAKDKDSKPKDYGAGFEKFYKLGLPDVSKGKYVSFIFDGSPMEYDDAFISSDRYKAFMLEENKQGKSIFVINNTQVIEAYDKDILENIRKEEAEEQKKQGKEINQYFRYGYYGSDEKGRRGAKWKVADFKKDLEDKIEPLGKHENDRTYEFGSLLLTAAHAYRLGYKDEANRLADAVFKSYPPQQAVTEAIGIIAEAKYEEALDKFYADGNWIEFSKQLEKLLATFKSGWNERPAVMMLAEKAAKMASYTKVLELEGKDLTDEDRKLAVELAGFGRRGGVKVQYDLESLAVLYNELWILPVESSDDKAGDIHESIIDRIKKRGMKSIPLLLALLKDDYLLKVDRRDIGGLSDPRSLDMLGNDLERMYDSIWRPLSRQDIALMLLGPLFNYDDTSEALKEGKKALIQKYFEWYEQHKNQTPVEIARVYLSDEEGKHRFTAMSFLIKNGKEEDIKFVETFLSDGGLVENLHLARDFCLERGDKGKEFTEKVLKALQNDALPEDPEKGFINETRAILNDLISPQSVQEIMNGIASGKRPFDENRSLLCRKVEKEKPRDIINIFLGGALSSREPWTSAHILWLLDSAIRNYFYNYSRLRYDEDISGYLPPISESAELWEKLLADTREIKDENERDIHQRIVRESSKRTIGEIAESALESLYGGSETKASRINNNFSEIIGQETLNSITKARIQKILAGVKASELSRYPDANKVSEQRKKEIIEMFKTAKDEDVLKLVASLNNDEKLAIFRDSGRDVLLSETEDGNIILKFWKPANTINSIESEAPEWNDLGVIGGMKGKPLDKATCEKLYDICRSLAREGKTVRIWIQKKACFGGISIRLTKIPEIKEKESSEEVDDWQDAYDKGYTWSGFNFTRYNMHEYMWPLDVRKEENKEIGKTDDLPDDVYTVQMNAQRKEFWMMVDYMCSGQMNVLQPLTITFTGYPAKKK